jgi:hypothetical protein
LGSALQQDKTKNDKKCAGWDKCQPAQRIDFLLQRWKPIPKKAQRRREGPLRAYPNNPWRGLLRVGEGIAFAYPAKFFG